MLNVAHSSDVRLVVISALLVALTWNSYPAAMGIYLGTEDNLAGFMLWISFLSSLVLSAFFCAQIRYGICGWEVAYLSVIEMMIYVTAIGWESEPPCSAYLISGQIVPWLRYVEWLITCPVILIALSRVGQSEGGYSKRTMKLLTSDQGTIILGILAASSPDSAGQALFYLCGVAYGFTTFYTAAVVYFEAWQAIPDECRAILKSMIYFFYSGWLMFPILFIIGPEGAGHITPAGSTIGHVIADLLSKQMWSICEYMMENKLHILNLLAEEEEEEEEEGG
nr:protein 113 [synthetic construct]